MPEPLERALSDLAFGPALDPRDTAAVRAWLERNDVPTADARAIELSGVEPLLVYRTLVRNNLREALQATIPRTLARLGGVFEELFDAFLAERPPRTRYLRDLTPDFLDFSAPRFATDPRVPAWLIELGRHEAMQIEIGALEARDRAEPTKLSLDAPLRFIEALRVARYDHAVHRLSDDPADRSEPAAEPTALLVYRGPEHEVRYLELTPLAADIIERLLVGASLGDAIQLACKQAGVPVDSKLLDATAHLLADLARRGALSSGGDG